MTTAEVALSSPQLAGVRGQPMKLGLATMFPSFLCLIIPCNDPVFFCAALKGYRNSLPVPGLYETVLVYFSATQL